tara:strand:+ start:862 stop:1299 length:438 start_codon:yes stop_codon:yes gene_type:complete
MNLAKYNRPSTSPFGSMMDEFFNSSLSDFVGGNYITTAPSINIIEQKDKFLVEVASPGLVKSNFDIKIDNDHLIISAKKETKTEEEKENYSRREFNYTSFNRSFYLPETVDSDKIDAKYKDGILTIALNKKEESIDNGPKEIVIG